MTTKNLSNNQKTIKICAVEECAKQVFDTTICSMHRNRFRRNGHFNTVRKKGFKANIVKCAVADCERVEATKRGWCKKHYARFWKHGDPSTTRRRQPTNQQVVYCVFNKITGYQYIGSTITKAKRKCEHFTTLKTNTHGNRNLQSAWNEFGADAFEFRVLEEVVDASILIEREQWWLDNTVDKYNVNKIAGINTGEPMAEETKERIRQSKLRGATPEYRERLSDIWKRKIEEGYENPCNIPIYQFSLDGEFIKEWKSLADAARSLGGHSSLINKCLKGLRRKTLNSIWRYKNA